MYRGTKDIMLPTTITGSLPRPSWYTENLGTRMEEIFKERAEKVAFVKGDNDVMFQDVAHAIDIMRGAGIDKVGLITAKLEAGQ